MQMMARGEIIPPVEAKYDLGDVIKVINATGAKCERLLIEGSGGLMVPLGEGFNVADLIAGLNCRVIVAARNRLGTINHTLLTVHALKANGIKGKDIVVALMAEPKPDLSSRSNQRIISDLIRPVGVVSIPFLGVKPMARESVVKNHKKAKTFLAKLAGFVDWSSPDAVASTLY